MHEQKLSVSKSNRKGNRAKSREKPQNILRAMDTLTVIREELRNVVFAPPKLCALGSPQHGLAEDLCPGRERIAGRLHHTLRAPSFPVHPKGKMIEARKTLTAGKPRKQPAS